MHSRNRNYEKSSGAKAKNGVLAKIRNNRTAYLMLLPFFVLFFLFTALPIFLALPLAFVDYKMPDSAAFAGIGNFSALFVENDLFLSALKNTLLSLVVTGLGGFLLSIIAAALIAPLKKGIKAVFTVIFCLPSFVYGAFAVWGLVLGGEMSSPLNSMLMSFGLITTPRDWLEEPIVSQLLVQLARLWGTFGIGFLVVLSGFEEVNENRELYETGEIDGLSNRISQFLFITIPASAPRLALAAVLQIAAAFSAGSLFTTTSADMTLTDYMLFLGLNEYDVGMASAVGVLITAAASLVYFAVRKALHRVDG